MRSSTKPPSLPLKSSWATQITSSMLPRQSKSTTLLQSLRRTQLSTKEQVMLNMLLTQTHLHLNLPTSGAYLNTPSMVRPLSLTQSLLFPLVNPTKSLSLSPHQRSLLLKSTKPPSSPGSSQFLALTRHSPYPTSAFPIPGRRQTPSISVTSPSRTV
jgi:hypothetical protein